MGTHRIPRNSAAPPTAGSTNRRLAALVVPALAALALAGTSPAHAATTAGSGAGAWGSNYYGQLGDGTTTERHTPVRVKIRTSSIALTQVEAGGGHSLTVGGPRTSP